MRRSRRSGELSLRLQMFLFAAVVPLLVRLRLHLLESILAPRRPPAAADPRRQEMIARQLRILRAGRWPFVRRDCLTRGLTAYYFLSRAGLQVAVCFGVGWVDGAYRGHCWLTREGEPLFERRDPRPVFTAMYTMPRPRG